MFEGQTYVNIEITVNRFEQLLLEKCTAFIGNGVWKKKCLSVLIRREFGIA